MICTKVVTPWRASHISQVSIPAFQVSASSSLQPRGLSLPHSITVWNEKSLRTSIMMLSKRLAQPIEKLCFSIYTRVTGRWLYHSRLAQCTQHQQNTTPMASAAANLNHNICTCSFLTGLGHSDTRCLGCTVQPWWHSSSKQHFQQKQALV